MTFSHPAVYIPTTLTVLLAAGLGYTYYDFSMKLEATQSELASSTERVAALEDELASSEKISTELAERLREEEAIVDEFSDTIRELSGDIGHLTRLEEVDEELLQKYSKVYFLNEHYHPGQLEKIDQEYVQKSEEEYVHKKVWPFLEEMLEDAEDDDVELRIISAFRSFDEQTSLKSHYDVVYGAGTANQFSASQGYSEHQLGTTIDFTTPQLGTNFNSFDQTEAYEWLENNAHKYGFVLSYPEDNAYYQFEPWHWRFVGEELAEDIHDDNTSFYDMDQREINKYRADMFD
ncbi:MAG: M15 family metallopeptidase [Candidatus Paceibacterota bacterium]